MAPPTRRIPSHITAIYTFAVVNLTILLNITLVEANVLVKDRYNTTLEELPDLPAKFGPSIPDDGVWGQIVYADPHNACTEIKRPPSLDNETTWIALIKRHDCDFDVKVLNAQKSGYAAALIHNVGSEDLVPMGGGKKGNLVKIPSAFIGAADGSYLARLSEKKNTFSLLLDNRDPFNANIYLVPFAIVVGICFILMLIFMLVKWIRDYRKKRRSRLSKANLKKIPIKKFKKGDPYDMCAICLDEYEDGEKLRVLPCAHAYHEKCIDPWLTKNKRVCPICKRKVIPGDRTDSESDTDSEDEQDNPRPSETTPLLTSGASGGRARGGNTFENSGLPDNMRPIAESYSDDSDGSDHQSGSYYQSSVEVHHTPQRERSINQTATARLIIMDETEDRVSGGEEDEEGPFGAVGGAGNAGFDVVEDHFSGDESASSSPSSFTSASTPASTPVGTPTATTPPHNRDPDPADNDTPEVNVVGADNHEDDDRQCYADA